MGGGGFEAASIETLLATRERLLEGLELVGRHIAAGTFKLAVKEGSAPPSQGGWLTLSLLMEVEDALEARILGYKRLVV